MKLHRSDIPQLYRIEYEPKSDERGSFTRIFCEQELATLRIPFRIAQVNLSVNVRKGILRGLHFQKAPRTEDKIVQCLRGRIYDVVLDLRSDSPAYGKWFAQELNESKREALCIPKGCAHGFQTLSDHCEILYFMSEFYSSEHYAGVRWDDPRFGIAWPIANPIVSVQDQHWPFT